MEYKSLWSRYGCVLFLSVLMLIFGFCSLSVIWNWNPTSVSSPEPGYVSAAKVVAQWCTYFFAITLSGVFLKQFIEMGIKEHADRKEQRSKKTKELSTLIAELDECLVNTNALLAKANILPNLIGSNRSIPTHLGRNSDNSLDTYNTTRLEIARESISNQTNLMILFSKINDEFPINLPDLTNPKIATEECVLGQMDFKSVTKENAENCACYIVIFVSIQTHSGLNGLEQELPENQSENIWSLVGDMINQFLLHAGNESVSSWEKLLADTNTKGQWNALARRHLFGGSSAVLRRFLKSSMDEILKDE